MLLSSNAAHNWATLPWKHSVAHPIRMECITDALRVTRSTSHACENSFNSYRGKKSSIFAGNTFERFDTFRDPEKFQEVKLITLRLASPDTIRRWAETRLPNGKVVGLVHNANTLHHNTLKPLKGGLFCERIFGPTKDFQCACGIQKEKNFSRTTSTRLFCLKCDVEYTWSLKRRYQSGYIRLVSPVAHLWYVKETPSFIAVMLDMKRKTLDSIIYCSSTLTIDSSINQLKNNFMSSQPASNWKEIKSIVPNTKVTNSEKSFEKSNLLLADGTEKHEEKSDQVPFVSSFFSEEWEKEGTKFGSKSEIFRLLGKRRDIVGRDYVPPFLSSFFSRLRLNKFNREKYNLTEPQSYFFSASSNMKYLRKLEKKEKKTIRRLNESDVGLFLKKQKESVLMNKVGQDQQSRLHKILSSKSLSSVGNQGALLLCHNQSNNYSNLNSFLNWTNFWTIAYKTAKKQIKIEYLSNLSGRPSNALTSVKQQTSLFFSDFFENPKSEIFWFCDKKDFLLVFYAQKTSKLFNNSPKFSYGLKPLPLTAQSLPKQEMGKSASKAWPFKNLSKTLKNLKKITKTEFLTAKSLKGEATKSLRTFSFLSDGASFSPVTPFRSLTAEKKRDKFDRFIFKNNRLYLSLTTFPVFLHMIMYLFQKCENISKMGNSFSSLGRKKNILLYSLSLKLKYTIKYWSIFKNFLFFQSILIKNNYSLKYASKFGNIKKQKYLSFFFSEATWVKHSLTQTKKADVKSSKRHSRFVRPSLLNTFKRAGPVFSFLWEKFEAPLALRTSSLKKSAHSPKFFVSKKKEGQKTDKASSILVNRTFKPEKQSKYKYFKNGSIMSGRKKGQRPAFPQKLNFSSLLNIFKREEKLSFWLKEYQFSSGNNVLILEKGFLMLKYFTKISNLHSHVLSHKDLGSSKSLDLLELEGKSGLRPDFPSYIRLIKNQFKKSFFNRDFYFALCVKIFQQLHVYKNNYKNLADFFLVGDSEMASKNSLDVGQDANHLSPSLTNYSSTFFLDSCRVFENASPSLKLHWSRLNLFNQGLLILLVAKLNNSLVQILLENKFSSVMSFRHTIKNITSFNKTCYSSLNIYFNQPDLSPEKTVEPILFGPMRLVGWISTKLTKETLPGLKLLELDKTRSDICSEKFSLETASFPFQLGLFQKLIIFEKLTMKLSLLNTLLFKNHFSFLKRVKIISNENYGAFSAFFSASLKKRELRGSLSSSFDKLIYVKFMEKGYLWFFLWEKFEAPLALRPSSLKKRELSLIERKRGKYSLLKRRFLVKKQLALDFVHKFWKKYPGFLESVFSETFSNKRLKYYFSPFFENSSQKKFARKNKLEVIPSIVWKRNRTEFWDSRGYLRLTKSNFSNFIDSWVSGLNRYLNQLTRGESKHSIFSQLNASGLSYQDPNLLVTSTTSKTVKNPTRLYNNIYVLSNRYFWDLDEDLQTFLHYLNEPTSPTDVCIPTYEDRLMKSNFFREPPPVLGGSLIQKLLAEFHPNECSKILMVLEKSLKTVNLLLKSCDDFLEARTLRLKRNYILRRLKYIRSGSYKFTDDFLRFSLDTSTQKFLKTSTQSNKAFKLKNLRSFLKESRPEWMVLSLLPVLPPDLRPILQIGNQVAASDLNRLYQKVIYRNERLKRFLKDSTSTNSPQIKFAYRLLQEAVDNLIDNGKGKGTPETDNRGLPLKSLTELLKGKKGRFRQNLLGKRVDYSGRSVIVVGPRLHLHECGLPKEMAIELFLPFLIQKIFQSGKAATILGAKLLLKTDPTQTWEFLTMVMRENPVLLNRAPTLHRFGFQAFQPRLVEGKAILLHPLVCPAFNADFDGDQMAVHVPITAEAKVEAWKLMLARNHLLSASTGEGMLLPSQDMVLGCYYLTATNPKLYQKTNFLQQYNYIFTSIEEVLQAYESQKINLHSFIWLRWNGKFQTNVNNEKLLELQINTKGQIAKIFKNYVIYTDSSTLVQSIFIKTTPGRVLFYNYIFN